MRSLKLCAALLGSTVLFAGGTVLAHDFEDGYRGPYIVVGSTQGTQKGEISLELKHDGKIEGRGKNHDNHAEFKIEGVVDEDGEFKGELEGKGFKLHLEGTMYRTKGHHLRGTLLQYTNRDHSDGAITLDLEGGHHEGGEGEKHEGDRGRNKDGEHREKK